MNQSVSIWIKNYLSKATTEMETIMTKVTSTTSERLSSSSRNVETDWKRVSDNDLQALKLPAVAVA